MPPKYLSTRQAAEIVGYTDDSSIRQAIRRGALKAEQLGRYWYITPQNLQKWLKSKPHYNLKNSQNPS